MPRPGGRRADGVDRVLVGGEVALRVGAPSAPPRRACRTNSGSPAASRCARVDQRLLDRLAGDELLAHHPHRQVARPCGSAARRRAPTMRRSVARQAAVAVRGDQLAGQQQAPGRGVDEQRGAVPQVLLPVAVGRSCRGSARRAWRRRGCAAALRPGTSAPRLPATTARTPAAGPARCRPGRQRGCARARRAPSAAPAPARLAPASASGAPARAGRAAARARAGASAPPTAFAQRRARRRRACPCVSKSLASWRSCSWLAGSP